MTSAKRPARRSESFRVRRWLQLGAASAGVSAALWGFSALAPTGLAAAEVSPPDTSSEAAGAEPAESSGAESTSGDDTGSPGQSEPESAADGAGDDNELDDADDLDLDLDLDEDEETLAEVSGGSLDADVDVDPEVDLPTIDPEVLAEEDDPEPEFVPTDHPWAVQGTSAPKTGQAKVAERQIADFMSSSLRVIDDLPVDDQIKYHLNGTLYFVRRAFLNQAPTVTSVVQFAGQSSDPVTGNVGAVDPEGDRIIYRVVQGPDSGTVTINPDGTYIYTPGADFDGVATFVVAAHDVGLHVNLIDLFRPVSTRSAMLVNQGAIRYSFSYGDGKEYWTPERRDTLRRSADALSRYFLVDAPVHLTYKVVGSYDPETSLLASAGSDFVDEVNPGFHRTLVQNKLLGGADVNGVAADGDVNVNFASEWALGDDVSGTQFDLQAALMHEFLHSFGFGSVVGFESELPSGVRSVFDQFIVTADGTRAIGDDGLWNTAYDGNKVGENGGLYFGGTNAVAAHGKLAPLFTPHPFQLGSSVSHLDDRTFTGVDEKMMNAMRFPGPEVRVLSPLELGIMRDLGYTVVYMVPIAQ